MTGKRGVAITGMGTQCAVAHDVREFDHALRDGRRGITYREPGPGLPRELGFRGRLAERPDSVVAKWMGNGEMLHSGQGSHRKVGALLRRASRSVGFSLLAAIEASWQARLSMISDRRRVALIVAGSNLSQHLAFTMAEKFRKDAAYVSPRYAHQFWDSEILGVVSEALDIRGEGMTVGGASAAGNLGLIHGVEVIRSGRADACLVLAGLQELSSVELSAFANLGALGAKQPHATASSCGRPFDLSHDGFVFGEGAAAVVLEAAEHAIGRGAQPLAHVADGVGALDGNHLTQPSQDGEEFVMREVLRRSEVDIAEIDLISAHATATPMGDRVEAAAIQAVFGPAAERVWVNATKSLLGHCLGSAALLAAIACVLQMRGGYVHPNVGITQPITDQLRLVSAQCTPAVIRYALNNSFGFGGINTAVLLRSAEPAHVPDSGGD